MSAKLKKKKYDKNNQAEPVAELLDEIIAPDTMGDGIGTDNMTCQIVVLNNSNIS